ncbi:MAG: hypothetical protein ACHQ53_09365 [Polyangiales bacterium]
MPGFATAILKVCAWASLLLGVGLAVVLSLSHAPGPPPAEAATALFPVPDYIRVVLELASIFFGFAQWALMLTVATVADQVERLQVLASQAGAK